MSFFNMDTATILTSAGEPSLDVKGVRSRVKAVTPPGLRDALRRVQRELQIARIHRRGVRKARRLSEQNRVPIKLHFGCGPRNLPGWINIDLFHSAAEINLDLRRPLPWLDNEVEQIYSEHFIEHLQFPGELKLFLADCLRILRPLGTFEAGLPDAEKVLKAYVQRDHRFFEGQRRWHPDWAQTPMDHVNYTFRQGREHQWAFDYESLCLRLREAGFGDIQRRDWKPELDSAGWEGSLYVSAAKPRVTLRT